MCSGDTEWPSRVHTASLRALSMALVGMFCRGHQQTFSEVYHVMMRVFQEEWGSRSITDNECYMESISTAASRMACCRQLYPLVQKFFQEVRHFFCADEKLVSEELCGNFEHFTHKAAVKEIYDFMYNSNVCSKCPYEYNDTSSALLNRVRRQYSVKTFLLTLGGILKNHKIPIEPQGDSTIFRQVLIVLGDLARCMTTDMIESGRWLLI